MTEIFIIKILLTPLLIAALTLIGRRWGPAVGGALAGLPLTSGPVSLFLALEQGRNFAAHSAVATLAGLSAVAAFAFVYSLTATRTNWIGSMMLAVPAFLGAAALFLFARTALSPAFLIVIGVLALVFCSMPRTTKSEEVIALPHPKWDLPFRIGIATALVFLLTGLASKLGPQITGLLSPFPVFGLVLTAFAHRRCEANDARRVLRGVVVGSFAFAVFFLVVGAMLPLYGCAATYSIAAVSALAVNALLLAQLRRGL